MLAYVFWHRPAAGVDASSYERALERFHRSLAHRRPNGFNGSASFRTATPLDAQLPASDAVGDAHEAAQDGYEDWYLIDGWTALGVLEEAAVSRGHVSRHDAAARMVGPLGGGVYRLAEGHPHMERARVGVWVTPASGHAPPTIADLFADGMDREGAGLWRRCLVLGPGSEFCLLAPEPSAGVAPTRLPAGWRARTCERELLWST